MAKQVIDGAGSGKTMHKLKSRNPVIEFDKLALFFGDPYVIDLEGCDGSVTVKQPTIGDIIQLGEKKYYSTLNCFITNTTGYRLQLWDQGYDWNNISDFELFMMLVGTAEPEIYHTFLPDLDFSKFGIFQRQVPDGDPVKVLYDMENQIEINEQVYFHLSQYLRNVFNIFPEEKMTKDKTLKNWFIQKDRAEIENAKYKKHKDDDSGLLPLISACCNHPGFKYKSSELKQLGIFQFYDSVKRLQVYESTTALQKGMYSGFVDGKNIKVDDYNFMRAI